MRKQNLVLIVSLSISVILVLMLLYSIRTFREHWKSIDSTTLILRDTLSAQGVSIDDILRQRKQVKRGVYEFTVTDAELLKRHEDYRSRLLEISINQARNERQGLVEEISLLVGLLAGFLALIGIGLPILNMTMTREELRQDRARYDQAVEGMSRLEPEVGRVAELSSRLEIDGNNVKTQLEAATNKLARLESSLTSQNDQLNEGVRLASEAKVMSNRLPILLLQFKLANALNRKLYEEAKRNGMHKKHFTDILQGVVEGLDNIISQKGQFEAFRAELLLGIRYFALDLQTLYLWGDSRAGKGAADSLAAVLNELTGEADSNFWTKVELIRDRLKDYTESINA